MKQSKLPVLDSTLSELITNKNINIQHVRLLLLHIGVELHTLFKNDSTSRTSIPIVSKKSLVEKCTGVHTQTQQAVTQQTVTTKTKKKSGGTMKNILKKTVDIIKRATTKYLNNDIPYIRKLLNSNEKQVKVKQCSRGKYMSPCKYTTMTALLLFMMYVAYVVHHEQNTDLHSIDTFMKTLPYSMQNVHKIPVGSKTETYHDTNECLEHIDTSLHVLFTTHTNVDQLRYELLKLRKKRSYFYGRSLLNMHLIRNDGTIRDNCGEIARAMAHHWSFQPVKSIREFMRQTITPMTRKHSL